MRSRVNLRRCLPTLAGQRLPGSLQPFLHTAVRSADQKPRVQLSAFTLAEDARDILRELSEYLEVWRFADS
jgi:hypothetical protein